MTCGVAHQTITLEKQILGSVPYEQYHGLAACEKFPSFPKSQESCFVDTPSSCWAVGTYVSVDNSLFSYDF